MKATQSALRPPTLITRQAQLDDTLARLLDEPVVAVDTESDSLYVYHEKVCLVQFSIPGEDFLVDPLSHLDISPLGQLFAHPQIEKVFHAAEYDVLSLKRDHGFEFARLFDTMWAARILGWPQVGLAPILEKHFGVKLDKRWQRYNWGKRPLDQAARSYARFDTRYLLDLRNLQQAELETADRLEEAQETFEQLNRVTPTPHPFDPDSFWRIKGVWDMTGRQQAIMRELHAYRDSEADRRNRPPFRILNDHALIALAKAQPNHIQDLEETKSLSALQIKRYGQGLLEAIERGQKAPIPRPSYSPRPDEDILNCYEAMRAWRNQAARKRGVEPDVIISNSALMSIAHRRPSTLADLQGIEGLGPWRLKTYGTQLLRAVQEV